MFGYNFMQMQDITFKVLLIKENTMTNFTQTIPEGHFINNAQDATFPISDAITAKVMSVIVEVL